MVKNNVQLRKPFKELVLGIKTEVAQKEFAAQYFADALQVNRIIKGLVNKLAEVKEEEVLV